MANKEKAPTLEDDVLISDKELGLHPARPNSAESALPGYSSATTAPAPSNFSLIFFIASPSPSEVCSLNDVIRR